jgi:hypothetical protein
MNVWQNWLRTVFANNNSSQCAACRRATGAQGVQPAGGLKVGG